MEEVKRTKGEEFGNERWKWCSGDFEVLLDSSRDAISESETKVKSGEKSLVRAVMLAICLVGAALLFQSRSAGAQDAPSGSITLRAVVCEQAEPADPLSCPAVDEIGAATFYADESGYVLPMADATVYDDALVWGEIAPVPLEIYFLETAYLTGPDGHQLWFILPAGETEGGGSEYGWYIALSEENPTAELVVVYTPIDVPDGGQSAEGGHYSDPVVDAGADSDGDGAPDDIEIAYGSDPYDAADHPAPYSSESGGEVLPDTGSGAPVGSGTGASLVLILIALGGIAFAGRGALGQRPL
jgi:hypothetical protein